MKIRIFDVFSLNRAIEDLITQDIKMSFVCGYNLCQMKKELDNIELYTVERLNKVINTEHLNNNSLTEEEEIIYSAIMNSEIEIKNYGFIVDELKKSSTIEVGLNDIACICEILNEKNNTSLIEN